MRTRVVSLAFLFAAMSGAQIAAHPCVELARDAVQSPALYETADVRVTESMMAAMAVVTFRAEARPFVLYLEATDAAFTFAPGQSRIVRSGHVAGYALRVEFKHPGCGAGAVAPDRSDALLAAPKNYRLLIEDAEVRVIEVRIPPHAGEPMHTHPWGGFIYVLHAEPLQDTTSDGLDPKIKQVPAGIKVVPAKGAGLHSTANLGDGELHAIRFELKHISQQVPPAATGLDLRHP